MIPNAVTQTTAAGLISAANRNQISVASGSIGQVLTSLNDGDQIADVSYIGEQSRSSIGLQVAANAGNPNDAGQPMGLSFKRLNGQNLKVFIQVLAAAWDAVYEDLVSEGCHTILQYASTMGTPDIIIRNLRYLGQWNGVDVSDPGAYKLSLNECSSIAIDDADFEWFTGGAYQVWGGGGSVVQSMRAEHWNPTSPFASLQGEHEIGQLDLSCIPLAPGVNPATAFLEVLDLGVPFDRTTRLRIRELYLHGRPLDPQQQSDGRLIIDSIVP